MFLFAQNCDCETNYEWVKKTIEENDAGFQYVLQTKGEQAYEEHCERILIKVKNANTLNECIPVLQEWLALIRSGHIGIIPNEKKMQSNSAKSVKQLSDWETYAIETNDFKNYLDTRKISDYEGIWWTEPYKIGIIKEGNEYIGFIIESGVETWLKGEVKLKFTITDHGINSVFYMRDRSALQSENVTMIGKNYMEIGDFNLSRLYPEFEEESQYAQYIRSQNADLPYLERLNETTLYLRIPSFASNYKTKIDSVLNVNHEIILTTKNLIIDIRDNGGGSNAFYSAIIPYLYTNPIRTVGVEFLSTKLNNQIMLDFFNKKEHGFDKKRKKWAREVYEKLESQLGMFVNIHDEPVSEYKMDTVYPFPQNIGIIINQFNGSTSEQFLLASKQSKKVKLFGVSTAGVLDITNMYFLDSPCDDFQLGYSISKSLRIPYFTIDDKGIQPDFYLDKSIPKYEWTEYVNKVLNQQ